MRQHYYYNMRQKFITKRVRFFITKYDSYYKIQSLLQIATAHMAKKLLRKDKILTNLGFTIIHYL